MQKAFNSEYSVYAAPFRFMAEDSLEEAIAIIRRMLTQASSKAILSKNQYNEETGTS